MTTSESVSTKSISSSAASSSTCCSRGRRVPAQDLPAEPAGDAVGVQQVLERDALVGAGAHRLAQLVERRRRRLAAGREPLVPQPQVALAGVEHLGLRDLVGEALVAGDLLAQLGEHLARRLRAADARDEIGHLAVAGEALMAIRPLAHHTSDARRNATVQDRAPARRRGRAAAATVVHRTCANEQGGDTRCARPCSPSRSRRSRCSRRLPPARWRTIRSSSSTAGRRTNRSGRR